MERALLELLSTHTSLAVAVTDAEGTLTLMTPALEKLLGHSYEPVREGDMPAEFHLFAAEGLTPLRAEDMPIARARRGETVIDAVVTARPDLDGERLVHLRVNAGPLKDPDHGVIRGAFALLQDVTDEWEARIREADLRQRLVATINHELRTPVTKLGANIEVLAELRDGLPEWARRALDALDRTTVQLSGLSRTISQIIDLEEAARVVPAHQDVAEMVRSLDQDLSGLLEEQRVHLAVDVPDELFATVDLEAMRRALHELVRNAAKLAPPESVLPVTVRHDGQCLTVTVADHWNRLDEKERRDLLEPFSPDGTGQAFSADGLGLAYARVIANALGGDLTLEMNSSEDGTDAVWRVSRHGERGQMMIRRLKAR